MPAGHTEKIMATWVGTLIAPPTGRTQNLTAKQPKRLKGKISRGYKNEPLSGSLAQGRPGEF